MDRITHTPHSLLPTVHLLILALVVTQQLQFKVPSSLGLWRFLLQVRRPTLGSSAADKMADVIVDWKLVRNCWRINIVDDKGFTEALKDTLNTSYNVTLMTTVHQVVFLPQHHPDSSVIFRNVDLSKFIATNHAYIQSCNSVINKTKSVKSFDSSRFFWQSTWTILTSVVTVLNPLM